MRTWPGGARLAVWVGVSTGGGAAAPASYAVRVGATTLLDRLAELAVPPALLLDTALCASAPHLLDTARATGAELVGHRHGSTGPLRDLDRSAERDHLRAVAARVSAVAGSPPAGWAPPGRQRTQHTLDLLSEVGYGYLLGLHLDDRPVRVAARGGSLLALPGSPELDATRTCGELGASAADFADLLVDEFEELGERAHRPVGDLATTWENALQLDVEEGSGSGQGSSGGPGGSGPRHSGRGGPLVMGVVLDAASTGSPAAVRRVTGALRHLVASRAANEGRVAFIQPRDIADVVAAHPGLAAPGLVRL